MIDYGADDDHDYYYEHSESMSVDMSVDRHAADMRLICDMFACYVQIVATVGDIKNGTDDGDAENSDSFYVLVCMQ